MYKIKQKPEDFIVNELSNVEFKDSGDYTYFLMIKKSYNTLDAISKISHALKVPIKFFGFAGNKDKIAITEQVCSVKNVNPERIGKIELKDIELKVLGRGDNPVSLGDLEGNFFEILVHSDKPPKIIKKFVNYFGEQRFGIDKKNIDVGRAIIKKDFDKLKELLNCSNGINYINSKGVKFSRIYVHAYQSYIWNECVKKILDKNIDQFPLIGFDTEFDNDIVENITKDFMKTENLSFRDFIIRQIPELSSEGDMRNVFCEVSNLEIVKLNEKEFLIKFYLPKGSYATEFLKQLFS